MDRMESFLGIKFMGLGKCISRFKYGVILWYLPFGNLTQLAGKSPCSMGNTPTHSWWIFQPAMLVYQSLAHLTVGDRLIPKQLLRVDRGILHVTTLKA